jgi:hypothetical protein
MTRQRFSAAASLWTICRIGPVVSTTAAPAGLVMKAASRILLMIWQKEDGQWVPMD